MAIKTFLTDNDNRCKKLACTNPNEAKFVYQKIFQEEEYGHLDYKCGDHIVDIGGNIGVFSKYAAMRGGPKTTLWSFEPMPPLYKCLKENVRSKDKCFNIGIGKSGLINMDYLPNYTLLSGHLASKNLELYSEAARKNDAEIDVHHAFESKSYEVQVVPLSIALNPIVEKGETISILKVDVEGMEHDVVSTIDDELWKCIQQVVLEVHDIGDRIAWMKDLLISQGFEITQSELASPSYLLGEGIVEDKINTCLITGIKKKQ